MRYRVSFFLLSLLLVAGLAGGSIRQKIPGINPMSPCSVSQFDRCNASCDFFDSTCWYSCMWGGGSGSGAGPGGGHTPSFQSCAKTCGNPCEETNCSATCPRGAQVSCGACCNIHHNRADRDCDGQTCRTTQLSEWNTCRVNCTGI